MAGQTRAALLADLPPEWPEALLPAIRAQLAAEGRVVVVLDDDPTGTQTVHDVPVVTVWEEAELAAALRRAETLLYVLTNSRSLPGPEAAALAGRLGELVGRAAHAAGRQVLVGIRGDSTLRGHFPVEDAALAAALAAAWGRPVDGHLLVPFFAEGGRLTLHGVHYVTEGEQLVPAGETEFARDATFGYRASALPEWVQEKSGGQLPAAAVLHLDLGLLRQGGPDAVAQRLAEVRDRQVVVADAVAERDLEVLVLGLLRAEATGRRFVYRTAASFYRVRGGQAPRPLLDAAELLPGQAPGPGGLIVVGSHVQRTSQQLARLLELPDVTALELSVPEVLDDTRRAAALQRAADALNAALAAEPPRDVVLFTSRQRQEGASPEASLALARAVSAALVALVRQVRQRPRFLVAKGGITASDLGTQALGVRRVWVPGQVAPGVPVWLLGPETPFPGLPYVVFPGNVGGPDTLAQVVLRLRGSAP